MSKQEFLLKAAILDLFLIVHELTDSRHSSEQPGNVCKFDFEKGYHMRFESWLPR